MEIIYSNLSIELSKKVGELPDPSVCVEDKFDSCRCFIVMKSVFAGSIADESILCIRWRNFGNKRFDRKQHAIHQLRLLKTVHTRMTCKKFITIMY